MLLSFEEVADDLGKTAGATRFWLHKHGLKAVRRIAVGNQGTRGVYDGDAITRHAQGDPACAACARRAPPLT
jgi:hypothetical protein